MMFGPFFEKIIHMILLTLFRFKMHWEKMASQERENI
jgi:hypothetical protein